LPDAGVADDAGSGATQAFRERGELTPAGAKRHLTCDKAAMLLRDVRPVSTVDAQRKEMAKEMLADRRWLNRRIPPAEDRLIDAVTAHGTTLTSIYGIADIGAATIIAIVGDVSRFPTAGHFAAFCGTAPFARSAPGAGAGSGCSAVRSLCGADQPSNLVRAGSSGDEFPATI